MRPSPGRRGPARHFDTPGAPGATSVAEFTRRSASWAPPFGQDPGQAEPGENAVVIRDESRNRCLEIISRLADRGAQGGIAGCTEIELLVTGDDAGLPYFPTTRLHAEACRRARPPGG